MEVGARIQERQKHSRRTRNKAPAASWLCVWTCDVLIRAEQPGCGLGDRLMGGENYKLLDRKGMM